MIRLCVRAVLLALGGGALCLLVGVSPASAHSSPISSDPKPNGTIKALPEQLSMTFDGPVLATSGGYYSMLVVADPMHEFINAPTPTVSDNTLSTVLSPSMLMNGRYTVSFRAFGEDGHASQGSWYFTVNSTLGDDQHRDGSVEVSVPATGSVSVSAVATGRGVVDGVGSPTGEAIGNFDINFTTSTMCYTITTTGLGDVTAGHIHSANLRAMTISDEIYLPIDLAAVNARAPVCAKQDAQSLANLAAGPSRFVLMIHTKDFPDGAAAGPFRLTSPAPNSTSSLTGPITLANYRLWLPVAPLFVGLMVVGLVAVLKRRSRRHSVTRSIAQRPEPVSRRQGARSGRGQQPPRPDSLLEGRSMTGAS